MPLYNYVCEKCKTETTVIQNFREDAPVPCPSCKEIMKRALGRFSFTFKGEKK